MDPKIARVLTTGKLPTCDDLSDYRFLKTVVDHAPPGFEFQDGTFVIWSVDYLRIAQQALICRVRRVSLIFYASGICAHVEDINRFLRAIRAEKLTIQADDLSTFAFAAIWAGLPELKKCKTERDLRSTMMLDWSRLASPHVRALGISFNSTPADLGFLECCTRLQKLSFKISSNGDLDEHLMRHTRDMRELAHFCFESFHCTSNIIAALQRHFSNCDRIEILKLKFWKIGDKALFDVLCLALRLPLLRTFKLTVSAFKKKQACDPIALPVAHRLEHFEFSLGSLRRQMTTAAASLFSHMASASLSTFRWNAKMFQHVAPFPLLPGLAENVTSLDFNVNKEMTPCVLALIETCRYLTALRLKIDFSLLSPLYRVSAPIAHLTIDTNDGLCFLSALSRPERVTCLSASDLSIEDSTATRIRQSLLRLSNLETLRLHFSKGDEDPMVGFLPSLLRLEQLRIVSSCPFGNLNSLCEGIKNMPNAHTIELLIRDQTWHLETGRSFSNALWQTSIINLFTGPTMLENVWIPFVIERNFSNQREKSTTLLSRLLTLLSQHSGTVRHLQ